MPKEYKKPTTKSTVSNTVGQGIKKPGKYKWNVDLTARYGLQLKRKVKNKITRIALPAPPPGMMLEKGDHVFMDLDNKTVLEVIKAARIKAELQRKRTERAAKKQEERDFNRRFESGDESVGRSTRQQAIRARKFKKKKKELIKAAHDVHYMGGDSDDEFENEGLHAHVQKRVDKKHNDQLILMDGNADSLTWSKLPNDVRRAVEGMKRAAESDPTQVHHSTEPRPTYTSAQLTAQTPLARPGLIPLNVHTGLSGIHDDMSHSIPWAQAPSGARALGYQEGGVNHPKNIPFENFVTNQVVNKAVENVAQTYLDQGKQVIKVVVRYWNMDHIEKSMHIYFVEGMTQPLVFGTRDLGDKKPARFSHR